jgi:hypothetical protein
MFDGNAEVAEGGTDIEDLFEHVLAATYSEPKVAVSTVDCNLEKKSIMVWLAQCMIPVTDFPLMRSWYKLASTNAVNTTFAKRWGASSGTSSLAPVTCVLPVVLDFWMSEWSGSSVHMRTIVSSC